METLTSLSDKHNFSLNQTTLMFNFCGGDLNKLDLLLSTLNSNMKLTVPNSKEETEVYTNCSVYYQMFFKGSWHLQTQKFFETFTSYPAELAKKYLLPERVRRIYNYGN